jgi:hypothetical protein
LTITARDRSIANKEVEITKQKAVVKTFKAKLGGKEVLQKAKLLQELASEQDAAFAILNGQFEFKAREAKADLAKALNVGCGLSTTTNMLKKLMSDTAKLCMDYDELAIQHCNSKSKMTRVKKELTLMTKKRVQ